MSAEIKPGQVWAWKPGSTSHKEGTEVLITSVGDANSPDDRDVWYEYPDGSQEPQWRTREGVLADMVLIKDAPPTIKPGDTIVTIQDAPTLLGYTVPKGTRGAVKKSGPPIMGPYSVYAHFEGDTPGDGRQVRPGDVAVVPDAPAAEITLQLNDATIIRHTTDPDLSDLYDAGWVKADTTPAPLDPSKVKAGDTVEIAVKFENPEFRDFTITGEVYNAMEGAGLCVGGWPLLGNAQVTLLAHQPAPEPEPTYEPGTVAVVIQGGDPGAGVDDHEFRAALQTDGMWVGLSGEAATSAPVSVRPLVVIDPAAVDVGALAEALRGEWSGKDLNITFSWSDIAKTVLTELGIEATS